MQLPSLQFALGIVVRLLFLGSIETQPSGEGATPDHGHVAMEQYQFGFHSTHLQR
jgi:hypothetical protein